MRHRCLAVLALAGLLVGLAVAQQKPPADLWQVLPAYFKKLDLTDKQKADLYRVCSQHDGKIAELQRQIAGLKEAKQKEMEKLLTAEQRKRLEALRTGEKGPDS